jgi:hypothetical protein
LVSEAEEELGPEKGPGTVPERATRAQLLLREGGREPSATLLLAPRTDAAG